MSVLYAVSDTHGDTYNYYKLLEVTQDADIYAHLGDYVRDGEKLRGMTDKQTYVIRGNGDFGRGADEQLICLDGVKILITHGHRYHVKSRLDMLVYRAMELDAAAVIYGHTHIPDITFENGIYIICPGTLSGAGTRINTYARVQNENGILKSTLFHI